MKNFILNKKTVFLTLLFLFSIFYFLFSISPVFAVEFTPQIGIPPGINADEPITVTPKTIGEYVNAFYRWSVTAIAIIAVIVIMISGVQWMTAGGNAPMISQAKDRMISGIIGLVLALLAVPLLRLVNPALVNLASFEIPPIIRREERLKKCEVDLQVDGSMISKKRGGFGGKGKEYVYCGDTYVNLPDKTSCIGQKCTAPGTGCYDMWDEEAEKGKEKIEKCLKPDEACAMITDENVKKLHGEEKNDVFNHACAQYNPKDKVDQCVWVEYRGVLASDDKCEWITKKEISDICSKAKKCKDLNNILSIATLFTYVLDGKNFAVCNLDLCQMGCYAKWHGLWSTIDAMFDWTCEKK